jgi:hypothetical protein
MKIEKREFIRFFHHRKRNYKIAKKMIKIDDFVKINDDSFLLVFYYVVVRFRRRFWKNCLASKMMFFCWMVAHN